MHQRFPQLVLAYFCRDRNTKEPSLSSWIRNPEFYFCPSDPRLAAAPVVNLPHTPRDISIPPRITILSYCYYDFYLRHVSQISAPPLALVTFQWVMVSRSTGVAWSVCISNKRDWLLMTASSGPSDGFISWLNIVAWLPYLQNYLHLYAAETCHFYHFSSDCH